MNRRDLKRGMKCVCRDGNSFIVSRIDGLVIDFIGSSTFGAEHIGSIGDDLLNKHFSDLDIVEVMDITLDGYKTIWERDEKKYYLKLPFEVGNDGFYLNYSELEEAYDFMCRMESNGWKTKFTQKEIDNLPSQEFIKTLIKEEVE